MPDLTVIAGCNGSGKSTYSSSFISSSIRSFDYDKRFLQIYRSMPDSEFREAMAKNRTTAEFEEAIESAIANHTDFCYETNFDSHPIFWAQKFRDAGFTLNLIFFCLETQEIARQRVQVRTENKGHFVNDSTIDFKWKAGYKNANLHFGFFDNILLVDNSIYNELYTNLLQIESGKITVMTDNLPRYLERRFPSIFRSVQEHLQREN